MNRQPNRTTNRAALLTPEAAASRVATAPKISISQSAWLWRGGLLCLLGGLGCGGGQPADLTLLWRLVDGRSCVDTAIIRTLAEVEGRTPQTTYESRCSERPENNRVQIPAVVPGARILLRGETLGQVPIYRGELRIGNPVPPLVETELYYTGGQ